MLSQQEILTSIMTTSDTGSEWDFSVVPCQSIGKKLFTTRTAEVAIKAETMWIKTELH